jgi:hypothetical protein
MSRDSVANAPFPIDSLGRLGRLRRPTFSGVPGPLTILLQVGPILTFIVSAIGTAATLVFTWRSGRRAREEAALRIAQLELQNRDLKRRLGEEPTP